MRAAVFGFLGVAIVFASVPMARAQPVSDPVDVFARAMAAREWADARVLVQGAIPQLTGTGPMITGGPHAGLWQQRVVAEKDVVSFDELSGALSDCSFSSARLLSGTADSPDKLVEMSFTCPVVYVVHFDVRRVAGQEKVSVYNLGKTLVTVPPAADAGDQQ